MFDKLTWNPLKFVRLNPGFCGSYPWKDWYSLNFLQLRPEMEMWELGWPAWWLGTDRKRRGLAFDLAWLGLVCVDHVVAPGTVLAWCPGLVEECWNAPLPPCHLAVHQGKHHVLPLLLEHDFPFCLKVWNIKK